MAAIRSIDSERNFRLAASAGVSAMASHTLAKVWMVSSLRLAWIG
jgi:hypothetical protein